MERALREQKFMKLLGRAYFLKSGDNFGGIWKGDKGETFEITRGANNVTAEWVAGKHSNKLSGTVTNRAAKITVNLAPANTASIRAVLDSKKLTGYAFTSEDGQRLSWMLFDDRIPQFAHFTRVSVA